MKFKFKENLEPVFTTDPYYDLFEGGYIKPEYLLEDREQMKVVQESIDILTSFLMQCEANEVIGLG